MSNPFVFGKIVDSSNFCNRVAEKKELQQIINNNYSTWLFAPRRYGKSSLIKQVFAETKQVKTVYFDLYNIKSIDDFSRKYSNILAKELFNWKDDIKKISKKISNYLVNLSPNINFDENGMPGLSLVEKEIKEQKDIETILDIPEKIAQEQNIKICIAFDEFQEIERIDKFVINWMRSSFQNQKNVSYIFSGSKQSLMQTIFSSINSPFYEYAIKMDIKPIAKKELQKFITDKFNMADIKIHKNIIEFILEKSECHPHFTQYFASVVYDQIKDGINQENKEFNNLWLNKIIDTQSLIFQNIYDQLNNNQRNILYAIAMLETEIFSKKNRKQFNLPSTSNMTININSLINKDLVNKEINTYKISNPIFKAWILKINQK